MDKRLVNVYRFFRDSGRRRLIAKCIPVDRAKLICGDSEGSSKTCKLPKNKRRTRECGPWFLGYVTIPLSQQIDLL